MHQQNLLILFLKTNISGRLRGVKNALYIGTRQDLFTGAYTAQINACTVKNSGLAKRD